MLLAFSLDESLYTVCFMLQNTHHNYLEASITGRNRSKALKKKKRFLKKIFVDFVIYN